MKRKSYLIILLIVFSACNQPQHTNKQTNIRPRRLSLIERLKEKKAHIDSLTLDTGKLIVLVKLSGNTHLQEVKKGMFPDSVETTYNILKDNLGHIIYIMESPYSESGDWDIEYSSYFDIDGRIFSFERVAGFFNSECTGESDDAAHESLTKFFNKQSRLVDSTYTLTGNDGKSLKKSSCTFNYDFPYKIIYRLKNYLKANKIDLTH